MDVRQAIADGLAGIEQEEDVIVFYACESGSRAWGFESQDSDYDVRFLYVRPTQNMDGQAVTFGQLRGLAPGRR